MRKHRKIFILIPCFLLLTVACANPFSNRNENQEREKTVKTEEKATAREDFQEIDKEKQAEKEEIAKKYNCEFLKNRDAKRECWIETGDVIIDMLYAEITGVFDMNRCAELPDKRKEECRKYIEETGVKGPITEEEKEELRKAFQKTRKEGGEGYYDPSACSDFRNESLKNYCLSQIDKRIKEEEMEKIIEAGDSTKCDTLKDNNLIISCKNEFDINLDDTENENIIKE